MKIQFICRWTPSENLFPIEDLKLATNKIFENPKVFQYGISNGITELREKLHQATQRRISYNKREYFDNYVQKHNKLCIFCKIL